MWSDPARCNVSLEIETKFAVEAFAPIRTALCRVGGERISCVFEENIVLDTPEGALRQRGMLLRLRRDAAGRITLKLPVAASAGKGLKVRQELETGVGDVAVVETILAHLGYVPALRYEKVRETWHLPDVEVCLDLLPFGRYLEIEGRAEAIAPTAASMSLSMDAALTATYHDLYQQYLRAQGLPPGDSFVFSPDARRDALAALAAGIEL